VEPRQLSPRALAIGVLLGLTILLCATWASADCVPEGPHGSYCLYRSLLPSVGIVASCRDDRDCRVGYYYGDPDKAVWLEVPPGMSSLPKPEVIWLTAALAQTRFDCGAPCTISYFFEAKRRRLSSPRRFVLAVDTKRLLFAAAEDRVLAVRQVFSGREVARIERDWAPAPWLGDAITSLRFDADGRLSITWLRGAERAPVSERVSIPSAARAPAGSTSGRN
jgi:hypothetical protein